MMKDLIGLCCGCLMGVVVPLLFCRLAKHWNVLSDIAAGEIIAYTSEVIPFCFCLFDCAYGLFNWLIFGSFRFLDIKIPTMALRVCAGGFLAILPAAALIVRVSRRFGVRKACGRAFCFLDYCRWRSYWRVSASGFPLYPHS